MKTTRHTSRGFTLIELMISLAVLTMALVGMMGLYLTAARSNKLARQLADAHALAVGRIETLRPLALAAISASANTSTDISDGGATYHVRHLVDTNVAANANLFRIRAEVSFGDDGDETQLRNVRLEVVRTSTEGL